MRGLAGLRLSSQSQPKIYGKEGFGVELQVPVRIGDQITYVDWASSLNPT
jgi:hypothetical protein